VPAALGSAAKLLSKDEARRIAANIAKLPEPHWNSPSQKSESASGKARGRRGLGFPALDQEPQADSSHARGVLRSAKPPLQLVAAPLSAALV